MNLSGTQLKDTYGNLLTIGTSAGSPTTGTIENGDGQDITALDVNGSITTNGLTIDQTSNVVLDLNTTNSNGDITLNNVSYGVRLRTNSAGGFSVMPADTTFLNVALNGDVSFYDSTGSNPSLFWDASTARLGLGTSSPNGRLNIKSSASGQYLLNLDYADNTDGGGFYESSSTDLTLFLKDSSGNTDVQIASNGNSYFNGGNVGIGTNSPNAVGSRKTLEIEDLSGTAIRLSESGVDNAFLSYDSTSFFRLSSSDNMTFLTSGSEAMRIDSSGNVGIGVTPDVLLHIGNSFPIFRMTDTDGGYGEIVSTKGSLVLRSDEGNTESDSSMRFEIDGSEAMRIDSSGNVGIGETNPLVPLHISKDSASGENIALLLDNNNTTANNEVGLLFRGSVGGQNTDFQIASINKSANNADLVFRSDGTVERMRILSGGGLTFNGDTATANALDDYEEGTWTPVYTPANNSFTTMTMNVVSATYTKIGRQVTARAYITTNEVVVGTASGGLNIDGLPFTSASGNDGFSSVSIGYVTNWGTVPNTGYVRSNNTEIRLRRSTGANDSSPSDLTTGATANQNQIMITATYFV